MKAMIFAAGLGSRLGSMTRTKPKALIMVDGKPLLSHVIEKLKDSGVNEIIINVHHLSGQIIDFIKANNNFGIDIVFSVEEKLLDTGGGVKKAGWFFSDNEPFFLHNVDILSDIDLQKLYVAHVETKASATLAVKQRVTNRYLLFDRENNLTGREIHGKMILNKTEVPREALTKWSFLGIHIVSPSLLAHMPEGEKFSIIDGYLAAAAQGKKIFACPVSCNYWFDLGKSESISEADHWLATHPGKGVV